MNNNKVSGRDIVSLILMIPLIVFVCYVGFIILEDVYGVLVAMIIAISVLLFIWGLMLLINRDIK